VKEMAANSQSLTAQQAALLRQLTDGGGQLLGALLDQQARSLASRMQARGLVRWVAPSGRRSGNLGDWTLAITAAGCATLPSGEILTTR
jgi:non-ribosomal peptide synthetase component F